MTSSTDRVLAGAQANNHFAFDLYARLAKPEENHCFSPFSIVSALKMVHAGARGETARQIESVLHLQPGHKPDPPTAGRTYLRSANAMWAHDGYPIRKEYAQLLTERFDAEIRSVDFEHEAEPVRGIINDWISRKTNGKINDLIDPPLDSQTRLILTNAVYFLSNWQKQFDRKLTRPEPFFVRPDRAIDAPLMRRQLYTRYIETDRYRAAEIQFVDDASMWVLLPREGRPPAELSRVDLTSQWDRAKHREVMLYLPRFIVRGKFELTNVLSRMGITDAFGERADFSGMHEPAPMALRFSQVIHESFTDVNEERAEAGAATAMGGRGGFSDPPIELRLDRPFLFIIRDDDPGAILFMGRVVDPTRE
jgi:serpin B